MQGSAKMHAIEVRAFPRHDDRFNQLVADVTHELEPDHTRALELALRRTYPSVRVSAQSSLATLGPVIVWYVFRDGNAAGPLRGDP